MEGSGSAPTESAFDEAFGSIYRREWGPAVAAIMPDARDLALAEDCVQEAFGRAFRAWSRDGLPDRPGAWIRVVAKRLLIDHVRSAEAGSRAISRLWAEPLWRVELETIDESEEVSRDDELALLLLCCHPAIAPTDQVLLMLRTVAGLTPQQIAPLFYGRESGVRSRLTRAKRKIRTSRIPLRRPDEVDLQSRLGLVLIAVRLAFTHGRRPGALSLEAGTELRQEAIRLARLAVGLTPERGEAWSLLALLLLTEVRTATATNGEGLWVPLANQDRSQWGRERIDEARQALEVGRRLDPQSSLQLEAEISAHHTFAATAADVDWAAIRDLYFELLKTQGENAGVQLNAAVAVAETGNTATALDLLDKLDPAEAGHPWRVHSAKAHVHQLAGDADAARRQWSIAAATAPPMLKEQLQLRADQ